ncbi:metal-dependent hydrolase [Rubrolithibacter danxiaensis]|uniref:metal-dependent hydrolase n=1 Tax=Rubrolithibacter danxiaensis TaxID=3390805 RepID=UPI003BF8EAB4
MKITYYGQSCFMIEAERKKLLFDPFITPNELAEHINVNSIHADYILMSHGHSDHASDLVDIANRTGATVISIFEIAVWLNKQGIEKTHPMNLGGKWKFNFGTVKMVFAAHSNSLPDGSYGGAAAGFILEIEGKKIYYAGDTALTQEMKLIGELDKPDLAFLPVGDNFTMGVDDAIIASGFIKCNTIIGMHFDTFNYIKIDKEEAITKFTNAGLNLRLLKIGETVEL